jgi:hypothetical protein
MKAVFALATLLLPSTALAQEGEEIFGIRERAWLASLSGELRADGDSIVGTDIDVDSTFDFDPALFHDVTAWLYLPLLVIDRINVGYWFGEFDEETTAEETFTFGDQTFTVGTVIDAELEFDVLSLTVEKFLLTPGTDKLGVALGIQAGLKFFDLRAEIRSRTFGVDESEEAQGPLPVIGGRLIAQLTAWFRFEAELVGIAGTYADIRGAYFEGVIEAAFQPVENVLVGLGYKLVLLRLEDESADEFEVDLRLGGLFLVAGVKF